MKCWVTLCEKERVEGTLYCEECVDKEIRCETIAFGEGFCGKSEGKRDKYGRKGSTNCV